MKSNEFQEWLAQKGRELYRDMPWRDDTRPYYVLVSELMLQQTQVDRVRPKFDAFMAAFPDAQSLAAASLGDVLKLWQGLGYNRRAKFLHEAAKRIVEHYDGHFPEIYSELITLPGVGKNTAGALMAYSFNQPQLFVETNIRSVYFHHFFNDNTLIDDKEILEKLAKTIDHEHPREFYWALMDYGSWLKRQGHGRIDQSKQYKKQSPLRGSVREVRGQIVRALSDASHTEAELRKLIDADDRFGRALDGLAHDGLVEQTSQRFHLTK